MEIQSWIITEAGRILIILVQFVGPLAGERVRKAAEEIFSAIFHTLPGQRPHEVSQSGKERPGLILARSVEERSGKDAIE